VLARREQVRGVTLAFCWRSRIVRMRWNGLALVVGGFLVVIGLGGLRLIFGVWMRPLEAEFGVDRSAISLVAALSLLVFGLGQPLLGRQVDVRGPRLIVPSSVLLTAVGVIAASQMPSYIGFIVTFSLIGSIGFAGAANATIVALVAQRFDRNRGLIFAVCSAGGPLGQMAFAAGAATGIEAVGWRSTMLWLGLVLLLIVLPVVAVLLRGAPAPRHTAIPNLFETFRLAFRARGFVLLWWAYFICGITTLGLVHTHVVAYGVDRGLPEVGAASILSLIGLFNIAGLILAGRIADRWGGRCPLIAAFSIRAVALLWLASATSETTLIIFALIFGLTDMATIPFSAAATSEMFGPRMLGLLTGLLAVAHQTGAALGSYLAGRGYELFGGYPPVIIVGVGVALVAALLSFAMDTRPIPINSNSQDGASLAPSSA
jgi:MFS family permease